MNGPPLDPHVVREITELHKVVPLSLPMSTARNTTARSPPLPLPQEPFRLQPLDQGAADFIPSAHGSLVRNGPCCRVDRMRKIARPKILGRNSSSR
jgi:hypothetical protein